MPVHSEPNPHRNRSLVSFRGDLESLSSMILDSWQDNDRALLYTPEFINSCLSYPGAGAALAPAFYVDNTPNGFAAAFPRRVRFAGQELSLPISAFLSVRPEFKRTGIGGVLLAELVKRVKAAGHHGLIQYCVEGGPMNDIVLGLCNAMRIPTAKVFTIRYMSRLLFPKRGLVEAVGSDPLTTLLELAEQLDGPFVRTWTFDEAKWQCNVRSESVAVAINDTGKKGVITGYIQRVAQVNRPKCLFIEDVLWGNLGEEEKVRLLKQFLNLGASRGAQLSVVPLLNYFDYAPFVLTHFRSSNRILYAYLSIWDGNPPAALSSMYIDVF